ncbi:MAG TPA: hypothetical protein VFR73_24835 [Hyphomicrobiaceae bacterium]|nr:hypothetical protein [Hyphomicrobiaceae bacterium]
MQPIREAASRLAAEGALELAPNRLIRVPCFSRSQTDELWSMRVLLDGYVAALFATGPNRKRSRDWLQSTRACVLDMRPTTGNAFMPDAQAWGLTSAAGVRAPLFEATIVNLRRRSAPHLAASLFAEAPDDPAFFQFTVHIQDELVLAVRTRAAERARELAPRRPADLPALSLPPPRLERAIWRLMVDAGLRLLRCPRRRRNQRLRRTRCPRLHDMTITRAIAPMRCCDKPLPRFLLSWYVDEGRGSDPRRFEKNSPSSPQLR